MAEPPRLPPADLERAAGMDHALYPFRALTGAPTFIWPGHARVALTVTIMLEHRELVPPADGHRDPRIVSPLGNFAPDWLTWSQHAYGNRVGIFRVLDVLDRFAITPSVALGSAAAEHCPELVDECLRRGACFLAHGTFATRRITSLMSEAEERAHIGESIAAVQRATGRAPQGWCGQDFNESARTPALLAEAGIRYTTDWPNDDRPFLLGPFAGRHVLALPPQPEWNDLECMWLRRTPPAIWATCVTEGAAYLHEEGGGCFNLTLHPWIIGQAHRIRYLADALTAVLDRPGIWRATTDAVAQAAAAQLTA